MEEKSSSFIKALLSHYQKSWEEKGIKEFISNKSTAESITKIIELQKDLMEKWEIRTIAINVQNEAIVLPNATENKAYNFSFEENFFSSKKIQKYSLTNLEELGLKFDKDTLTICGQPNKSGSYKIIFNFKVLGELESDEFNEKELNFVVNPDPKSLWKNIASDENAIYWKEDNRLESGDISDRRVVVSSKRGRSHQNVGSFRDDDFAFKNFEKYGWGIVAVSDGAGSAPLSRKGSNAACLEIIKYFEEVILANNELQEFEKSFNEFLETKDEIAFEAAKNEVKNSLYKGSLHVHNELNKLAQQTAETNPEVFEAKKVKYNAEFFHSTLIFAAIKKINNQYLILTFGVGDCPIGIVNKDKTEAKLLNWLDVGEFGGGTRFITQPEIFHSKERPMASRFNIHVHPDFSFLFLMSDGIYDPKFEVEANLEKTKKWIDFISDLEGENEDKVGLNFIGESDDIEKSLNKWMDFWSKGNHDDRTLAIIY